MPENINTQTSDFLIIGGGIIGLTSALRIKELNPQASVVVLEKENECGLHASGRNSGVIHAGFYYTKDSLKAKFTRQGNLQLREYCKEKKIPVLKCGKLVVAKDEHDLPQLHELYKRGMENGVDLFEISDEETKKIEPRAITLKKALYSPTTCSVNPSEVLNSLYKDVVKVGVRVCRTTKYFKRIRGNFIQTSVGKFDTGYLVNAAGLYADKIAREFNFSQNHRILPFKGLYLYSSRLTHGLRTHIYPVPDLNNPFLGVHFTLTVSGKVKIGPTAIPALWREQYKGLANFNLTEVIENFYRQVSMLFSAQFDFRRLAIEEIKKYYKKYLVAQASKLCLDINAEDFNKHGESGIRAQLFNIKTGKLEMDFILEGDNKSMHVLNAVSPGFTSAFPFADHIAKNMYSLMSK